MNMEKIKKFFNNIIFKSILLTVLPVIYSLLLPLSISVNKDKSPSFSVENDYLFKISIFLFIFHIIAVSIYGKIENDKNKQIEKYETSNKKAPKEVAALSDLLKKYNKVIKDNADKLYDYVSGHHGHSDVVDWQWMQSKGDEICEKVHEFLKKTSEKGYTFSVSIMFRKQQNNVQGFTMMSRDSSDAATHCPKSYRNFILEEEAEGTFYKWIFDNNPTEITILMNKKQVEKNFADIGDVNYSQYIGIPISCKGKVVGILQIVTYNNTIITNNKNEMIRLCNDYFSIAANSILLTDKVENITQKEDNLNGLH